MKNERMEGEQGREEKGEGEREKRLEFRRKPSIKEDLLVAIGTPVEAQPPQPPRLQLFPKAKMHSPQTQSVSISSSSRIPGLLCNTALKDTGSEKEAEEGKELPKGM